jgi:hypothetical protein
MIVIDTSRIFRLTIVSDAPSCCINYDCHSDNSKMSLMLLENIYSTGVTHDDRHIFILQATGFSTIACYWWCCCRRGCLKQRFWFDIIAVAKKVPWLVTKKHLVDRHLTLCRCHVGLIQLELVLIRLYEMCSALTKCLSAKWLSTERLGAKKIVTSTSSFKLFPFQQQRHHSTIKTFCCRHWRRYGKVS